MKDRAFARRTIRRTTDAPSQHTSVGDNAVALAPPDYGIDFIDRSASAAPPVQRVPNRTGMPDQLKAEIEALSGMDLSDVRVHANSARPAQINALAYAQGNDIHLAPGQEKHLPHEAWHVLQQRQGRVRPTLQAKGAAINDDAGLEKEADVMGRKALQRRFPVHATTRATTQATETAQRKEAANLCGEQANGAAAALIQRQEVQKDSDIQGKQDWTTADREGNTQRWKDACLTNLNAVDSSQYVKIVERRDFYKWFYEYAAEQGFSTRWALAAYVVANGAHQIADMDVGHAIANDTLGMANVELQGIMREGNQVIFDNVLPKLKRLIDGGPLSGPAALQWDMQVLADEQTLIQPMYSRMSKQTVEQLNYIARKRRFASIGAWWTDEDKVAKGPHNVAGTVPGFDQPNIQNISDRWKYGMKLGNQFTSGGTGFDPNKDTMPAVSAGYQSGSEFVKVDTRAALHELDAWLNPNRFTRMGPGSGSASTYIPTIISKLSEFEEQQVLSDRSPDGWAYSMQFAQFSFITEAMVKQALPSAPALAGAVAAFLARYNAERVRAQLKYPNPTYPIMVP